MFEHLLISHFAPINFPSAPYIFMQFSFSSTEHPFSSHIFAHSSFVIEAHLLISQEEFIFILHSELISLIPHSFFIILQSPLIPPSEEFTAIYGAITKDTIDINLIKIFMEGPDVSLNG